MNDMLPYIERYFNGELSNEEKKVFESRCLSDPAFARMVAFYISLQEYSQQQWAERKKEQFAKLEAEAFSADATSFSTNGGLGINEHYEEEEVESGDINPTEKKGGKLLSLTEADSPGISLQKEPLRKEEAKVRPMMRWKTIAVAAAMLGVIAAGISLYVQNPKQGTAVAVNPNKGDTTKSSPSSDNATAQNNNVVGSADKKQEAPKKGLDKEEQQQLYAQNFTPDAPPEQRTEMLEDAFNQYDKKSYKQASIAYEEAQKVMESLTTRSLEDEQEEAERQRILFYAHYYNAQSYMAAGNATKAIRELQAIKESPDGYWRAKQQWYLALAYLKTGEVVKATTLLQKVATSKHAGDYRQKATQLNKALQEE